MKSTIVAILLLTSVSLFAGNNKRAKINGVVYENVRGYKLPLSLATIQCKGTTIGTFSKETGDFNLDLPEGKYTVTFTYVGYKPVVRELKVKKNKDIYLEITLDQTLSMAQK